MPKYRRKVWHVDAIQYEGMNIDDVEMWVAETDPTALHRGLLLTIKTPVGIKSIGLGDYLVRLSTGIFVDTAEDFEAAYEWEEDQ